jgi:hypothetical protein
MPFRSRTQAHSMSSEHPRMTKTRSKHVSLSKALPEHVKFRPEKRADGPGWDPSLAIFKPLPSQQVPQGPASPLAGQGGGFRGVVQSGQPARADGTPQPAQGGGNPLDRYGPARRRRLLTDPLVVGGAFFGKGAAFAGLGMAGYGPYRTMQPRKKEEDMVGKEASLQIVGRQVGKTGTRMTMSSTVKAAADASWERNEEAYRYLGRTAHTPASGMGKMAHAPVAAGDRELRAGSQGAGLRGAMGAFEWAWVEAGWADMSPAPAPSCAPQVAAPLPTGTAPHTALLSTMQGKPAAPAPAIAPPQPLTTPDGRTPGFTNPMPGAENPPGAGTPVAGTPDRPACLSREPNRSPGGSSRNVRNCQGRNASGFAAGSVP